MKVSVRNITYVIFFILVFGVNKNKFVIKDKNKEVEIHILIEEKRVELKNLTKYKYPPFFEMMKAGDTSEEAHRNWLNSLPPGTADFIRENQGW